MSSREGQFAPEGAARGTDWHFFRMRGYARCKVKDAKDLKRSLKDVKCIETLIHRYDWSLVITCESMKSKQGLTFHAHAFCTLLFCLLRFYYTFHASKHLHCDAINSCRKIRGSKQEKQRNRRLKSG